MPIRIPAARRSELLTFGVGGIAAFAPLYMMMPGATERLASQTTRWAPRWYVEIFNSNCQCTSSTSIPVLHDVYRMTTAPIPW